MTCPNLLFVFADQWRARAFGYAGDPSVRTPNIDRFAAQSVNCVNAVSGCPVCSPYRASLMTGQYPHTHGMIVNDQAIRSDAVPFAAALANAGYDTGYIGKWHIGGRGRSARIPPEERLGFQYWRGYECTHDYNDSFYDDTAGTRHRWEGYDAFAQTDAGCEYLRDHGGERPFALFLSWGPPHNPYGTAPQEYRDLYPPDAVRLPPNVPEDRADEARQKLAGYYAHCTALDEAFGRLLAALDEAGRTEDTLVVFTSDHGDMLNSQGSRGAKQQPWDESIRVPLLLRIPGQAPGTVSFPMDAPELMPTLLRLCGVRIPETVTGADCARVLTDAAPPPHEGAFLANYFCFHEWVAAKGGREWRGIRTDRHTYAIDHDGPWLLYDNQADPLQLTNLVNQSETAELRRGLDAALRRRMADVGDAFEPGIALLERFDIGLNDKGDIPIKR